MRMSPCALRSMRRSRFAAQSAKNSPAVRSTASRTCSTNGVRSSAAGTGSECVGELTIWAHCTTPTVESTRSAAAVSRCGSPGEPRASASAIRRPKMAR